ncbi:MAG: cytochrome c, partial [Halopseudomonas sp.]
SASVYAEHDRKPELRQLTGVEKQGEGLFQDNCAFCHAADGTGKNWIGSFLDSHPRDLTDSRYMGLVDRPRLKAIIREGVVGASMPAWKSVLDEAQIDALVSYISRAFSTVGESAAQSQP